MAKSATKLVLFALSFEGCDCAFLFFIIADWLFVLVQSLDGEADIAILVIGFEYAKAKFAAARLTIVGGSEFSDIIKFEDLGNQFAACGFASHVVGVLYHWPFATLGAYTCEVLHDSSADVVAFSYKNHFAFLVM